MRMSELNSTEEAQLSALHAEWAAAREAKDYAKADALRAELSEWGCLPPTFTLWHPVSETPAHRLKRFEVRQAVQ